MAQKNRKTVSLRGSRTYGYGNAQKHRGAGSRGGRGKAGSKKHKWHHFSKYHKGHFGHKGFKRPESGCIEIRKINVGFLSEHIERFVEEGYAKKTKKDLEVDLTKAGFHKLLGSGTIDKALIIKVGSYSERAKEKVEKAGGKIEGPPEPEVSSEGEKTKGK
ncbi:MAG: uL15 family ribosomal protein [Candidatus Altiarchaeota archaeon]